VLTRKGLDELKAVLQAGDPGRGIALAELLRGRSVRHSELDQFDGVAKEWVQARELADRGEFNMALLKVERLRRQLPQLTALERCQQDLTHRREDCTARLVQLHDVVEKGQWRKVVEMADQVLAVAPQQSQARKAKAQAWKVVEPSTIGLKPGGGEAVIKTVQEPPKAPERFDRFMLWIDGVGGYLVCLNNRLTLGQATPDAAVDIAFYADLSRLHANLTRDGSNYLVEAGRPLRVNGQPTEKALLQPGDRVTLGTSCQMKFTQPVPVSATARLDLTSGHRLALAVEAVLLMADTLVIGPGTQVHVAVPDLSHQVILFRQKDGLAMRYPGSFMVDGQKCQERSQLGRNSKVAIDDCCFTVEMVGSRLGLTI
jgi:hypothetical protein